MKNNRATIWFLVVAVAGIWGAIVYQLIDKDPLPDAPGFKATGKTDGLKKDPGTYRLILNYGDPFFPSKKKVQKVVNQQNKQQKPVKKWPAIKYNGCLSTGKDIRGHFIYQGKSMILKPGDSIDSHSVLKEIFNDSVLISYHHEQKWFFR